MKSKTFACIKSVAVKIAIILLAIMYSIGMGNTLSWSPKPVSDEKVSIITNVTMHPYFEFSKGEQEMCTQFKEDVMNELVRDKEKRGAFFQELRAYVSEKMSMQVLDIALDDTQVCIIYTRQIKQKAPFETNLARASRAGFLLAT